MGVLGAQLFLEKLFLALRYSGSKSRCLESEMNIIAIDLVYRNIGSIGNALKEFSNIDKGERKKHEIRGS